MLNKMCFVAGWIFFFFFLVCLELAGCWVGFVCFYVFGGCWLGFLFVCFFVWLVWLVAWLVDWLVSFLLLNVPAKCNVYLRDGSAQRTLRAATLREVQIKSAASSIH